MFVRLLHIVLGCLSLTFDLLVCIFCVSELITGGSVCFRTFLQLYKYRFVLKSARTIGFIITD